MIRVETKKLLWMIIPAVVLLAIVIFFVYLFWPRSLKEYTENCETIRIYYVETEVNAGGETDQSGETAEYIRGDQEYDMVLDILNSCTVHKTMRGLAQAVTGRTAALDGNADGYYLNIYLYDADGNCTGILCGGTGEIIVDEELCRMGYFGSKTCGNFMEEILAVFRDSQMS